MINSSETLSVFNCDLIRLLGLQYQLIVSDTLMTETIHGYLILITRLYFLIFMLLKRVEWYIDFYIMMCVS